MKATEFRIGNYVFDPGNELLVIIGIHHDFDDDGSGNIFFGEAEYFGRNRTDRFKTVELNGIPLTPEWLERFGFGETSQTRADGSKSNIFSDGRFFLDKMTHDPGKFAMARLNNTGGESVGNVEYVHQLQNLYFDLTGKELTMKGEVK